MNQSIDLLLREADPVTDDAVERWRRSAAAAAIRATTVTSTGPAALDAREVPRRRRAPSVALVAAALLVVGAGGGAAAILLGRPAPPAVKDDLRGIDAGFPADLRYDPDVADARSVATTGSSTLYYARLKDGGHCTEIVTSGVARGAVCTSAAQMQSQPIEVTIPFTDPVTEESPVTIGGRVNADRAASVEIRYGDGSSDQVALGDDAFFVFDVPSEHLAEAHHSDITIVALDRDGRAIARAEVPAVEAEPAGPVVDSAPITVDTISDASDFTKVLGLRGRVNAPGAVSLEFRYPDGTTVAVPLRDGGHYSFDIPASRQRDLAEAPGTLVARDAGGGQVASVPVASVSFWRGYVGGSGT